MPPTVNFYPYETIQTLLAILIAKGDVLTRNGSGQLVRVPVGSNGQQLTANNAKDEGVDWQAGTVAPVTSVFSRVGAVIAAIDDYAASEVENDSGVGGAQVSDALDILAAAIIAITGSDVLVFGARNVAATTATRYLFPSYSDGTAPTAPVLPDTPPSYRVPRAGTIRRMYVRQNNPGGNGAAIVYTLRVNGVPTALTVSIASTAYDANDLVNSVAVAQGARLDLEVTKAAIVGTSPIDLFVTMEFV